MQVQGFSGLILNNLVYANRTGGVFLAGSGSGARVLNNTIYQPAGDAINVNIPTNVLVQNNIIQVGGGYAFNVSATSQPTFRSDYNTVYVTGAAKAALWNGVDQATLAAYQNASAQEFHGIGGDPKFNNPAGGDGVLGYASAHRRGDHPRRLGRDARRHLADGNGQGLRRLVPVRAHDFHGRQRHLDLHRPGRRRDLLPRRHVAGRRGCVVDLLHRVR